MLVLQRTVEVSDEVRAVLIDDDGRVVVAVSGSPLAVVASGATRVDSLDGDAVHALLRLRDGRILCGEQGFHVRDSASLAVGVLPGELATRRPWIYAMAASRDGAVVGIASDEGWVSAYELASGARLARVRAFPDEPGRLADTVWAIAVSPDGARLAAADRDHTRVALVDVGKGELDGTLDGDDEIYCVGWLPDGELIAGGSRGVRRWNLDDRTSRAVLPLADPETPIWTLATAPGGRLACAGADQRLHVGDVEGGAAASAAGHGDIVQAIAWSPDGRLVVTGGDDRTVRIWEVAS